MAGWGNPRPAIEKSTEGEKQQVGRDRAGRVESGRWYDLRVGVEGTNIRGYLDGQILHELADPGFLPAPDFAHSAVRDSNTGDVILKWVNGGSLPRTLQVELPGLPRPCQATLVQLSHDDPLAVNDFDHPFRVQPRTDHISVSGVFTCTLPPCSLTVVRVPTR